MSAKCVGGGKRVDVVASALDFRAEDILGSGGGGQ